MPEAKTQKHGKVTSKGRRSKPSPKRRRVRTDAVLTGLTSKVTSKAQTTLPSGVRRALDVQPGEYLRYTIEGHRAIIEKATVPSKEDPVLGRFLMFLAEDMKRHPEHLSTLPDSLLSEIRILAHGIAVDHDAPVDGEFDL